MIAGELAHLARKMHAAIGEQNFGLADAAGIKNDLAGRRIAGVVLEADPQRELAQRSGLSLPTIQRMESSDGVIRGTP